MQKNIIPIAFAVDDNYCPCLSVAANSILKNASKDYFYKFYVLITTLSEDNKDKLCLLNTENSSIEFINVTRKLDGLGDKLHLRDYYTCTTYYRFFIPAIFPQYDKILYLDSDIVVLDDISKIYNTDLTDKYLAAIQEEVMATVKVFGDYVEEGLGIPCENYFNAGVALFNLKELRKFDIENKFIELLSKFKFEVTQDQDYLNVLCKNKVVYLDLGWNKTPFKNDGFDEKKLKLIHYKLYYKPWMYNEILYSDYFWEYAKKTPYYEILQDNLKNYTKSNVVRDLIAYKNLMKMAKDYTESQDNYKKTIEREVK